VRGTWFHGCVMASTARPARAGALRSRGLAALYAALGVANYASVAGQFLLAGGWLRPQREARKALGSRLSEPARAGPGRCPRAAAEPWHSQPGNFIRTTGQQREKRRRGGKNRRKAEDTGRNSCRF
jgi:hypothetical protein